MENIKYFNDMNEANNYIASNNINKDYIDDRNVEKYADYFAQFTKVEGCRVLIAGIPNGYWYELQPCIEWNGVYMMLLTCWRDDDAKTHRFQLVERLDKKGFDVTENYDDNAPNKIGTPTAKKLNDWAEWLCEQRRRAENKRDRIAARIPEHIAECCRLFPEAANVEWSKGYWLFEKEFNGISYVLEINSNGRIYEKTSLSNRLFPISPAEKAARLMQNALQFCA